MSPWWWLSYFNRDERQCTIIFPILYKILGFSCNDANDMLPNQG